MEIGERIKIRRIELGMSQDELATKLGYKSRSSINKIELGGRELRQTKIAKIAEALETTPGYIMGWTEEKQPTGTEASGLDSEIADLVKQLTPGQRKQALDFLRFLKENPGK